MLAVAYLTWLSQPAWLGMSICSLLRGPFPFTTQSTDLTSVPCAVGTAQLLISVAFSFLSLWTKKQGGTPDNISRSELPRVVCFTRCITEQSFSVKPSLSAPDYHPVLHFSFCLKYTEIEKPLWILPHLLRVIWCRIYLWSAGFSFPGSVPSQISHCLLATVAEWETKKVWMLCEHCSAIA